MVVPELKELKMGECISKFLFPVSLAAMTTLFSQGCEEAGRRALSSKPTNQAPVESTTATPTRHKSGREEEIIPTRPGDTFHLEIKTFDELLQDQISYHAQNSDLTEKEVLAHLEAQRQGIHRRFPGGDVYAFGYLSGRNPIHVVFAPVNGGKINPGDSATTNVLAFYDPAGRLLAYAISAYGGGWIYQSQRHGGAGSNVPRSGKGIRDFHYVFSVDANEDTDH